MRLWSSIQRLPILFVIWPDIEEKMILHQNFTKNGILWGIRLRHFSQVLMGRRLCRIVFWEKFSQKTPTHITYAIKNFYQNFEHRIPSESCQNFCILRISGWYSESTENKLFVIQPMIILIIKSVFLFLSIKIRIDLFELIQDLSTSNLHKARLA